MYHIPLALTYDDVLIIPKRSTLQSRSEANIKTRLTKNLNINIPIVSSNMDTVTEAQMAITLARMGGIGILHRFMDIANNVEQVKKVKRAQNYIVHNPYIIDPQTSVQDAKHYAESVGVTGLLVANNDRKLLGILSKRDFLFANGNNFKVQDIMTPREKLIISPAHTTFDEAKKKLTEHKIEKLPLVDDDDHIVGLITSDDMSNLYQYPNANLDHSGCLLVGASVGVHGDYLERTQELIKAGVDVIVVDIAHGHSNSMFNAIAKIREICGNIQLISGNIATASAARELCEAGVDAIKVGIGPGTICVTRLVTGCGMPQLTAVLETSREAQKYGVPIIADGGIQKSGDIVKAIGAGADTVMLGGMLAGTQESPGVTMQRGDRKYKICRGSASFTVAQQRKTVNQVNKKLEEVVPEGIESIVPYKGSVTEIINQLTGGLKSGMSYTNSHTIAELQNNAEFVRITNAGTKESGSHDVNAIT